MGKGVRQNKKRARSYFMKACDQGHSAGCAFGIAGL
jgi:TPR repeat protein